MTVVYPVNKNQIEKVEKEERTTERPATVIFFLVSSSKVFAPHSGRLTYTSLGADTFDARITQSDGLESRVGPLVSRALQGDVDVEAGDLIGGATGALNWDLTFRGENRPEFTDVLAWAESQGAEFPGTAEAVPAAAPTGVLKGLVLVGGGLLLAAYLLKPKHR